MTQTCRQSWDRFLIHSRSISSDTARPSGRFQEDTPDEPTSRSRLMARTRHARWSRHSPRSSSHMFSRALFSGLDRPATWPAWALRQKSCRTWLNGITANTRVGVLLIFVRRARMDGLRRWLSRRRGRVAGVRTRRPAHCKTASPERERCIVLAWAVRLQLCRTLDRVAGHLGPAFHVGHGVAERTRLQSRPSRHTGHRALEYRGRRLSGHHVSHQQYHVLLRGARTVLGMSGEIS